MLRQCSLRHRFRVCSSGGNSNRKSSFWRLVGICVFPCRVAGSLILAPQIWDIPKGSGTSCGKPGQDVDVAPTDSGERS